MKKEFYKQELEIIAQHLLETYEVKPNFSNRDFMNITQIFSAALMDKMYDLQDVERIQDEDRGKMAEACGNAVRDLIRVYTGLDTRIVVNEM